LAARPSEVDETAVSNAANLSDVMADVSEATRILCDIEDGNRQAADQLLPLVYDELRKLAAHRLAQEKPGQTFQPTALVHEAYVRLVDVEKAQHWNSCGHFFAAAAEAMRRILIEHARRKGRLKRGGGHKRAELDDAVPAPPAAGEDLIALDEALTRLAQEDAEAAGVVQLRYFAGLSIEDAAHSLGISRATAYRHWTFARAWLLDELAGRTPEQ
jgi:RNA polymerase sigma factor (TIGR02999 family)